MKIALIHDWLTGMRGGEKVLEVLCGLFPKADVFTLVHRPGRVSPLIESHRIITSPLQKIPGIGQIYRHFLPLMPWAIEQFDFRGYDVLISTSHCVAKGAIPPPGISHICYCHTPMRYIWDQYDHYFGPGRASWPVRMLMKALRPRLQRWDIKTLPRVTTFLANSKNVHERIDRLYQRKAEVLYPPVDTDFYTSVPLLATNKRDNFYLVVGALAPYKRIDLAIDACRRLRRKLVVIGEGQTQSALQAASHGADIQFLGWQAGSALREAFSKSRALLFPGEEDFGIVPLEAQAAGCPVIALGRGGALETVVQDETGIFFSDPSVESFMQAIERFERRSWDPALARAQAQRFSRARCEKSFRELLKSFAPSAIVPE